MKANGFTLVELLITLAVMGLLASAVVLTMRGGDHAVGTEAARFASRIAATRDEAILSGTSMGIWMTPSGYGFERFQDGQWKNWEQRPLVQRDWAAGVSPALSGPGAQRLRFDPVGLPLAPAKVTLTAGERSVQVSVSAMGEVAVR